MQREVAALRDQAQANLAFYEAHGSDVALLESSRAAAFEEVLSLFPRQDRLPTPPSDPAPSDAGWAKVDDQLPGEQGQDSEEVIVFLNGHCDRLDMECRKGGAWGHRFGWFDAERQCFRVHGRPEADVTHWMLKPPPPSDPAPSGQAEG